MYPCTRENQPAWWSDDVLKGVKFALELLKNNSYETTIQKLEEAIDIGEDIKWRVREIYDLIELCEENNSHKENEKLFFRMLEDLKEDSEDRAIDRLALEFEFAYTFLEEEN